MLFEVVVFEQFGYDSLLSDANRQISIKYSFKKIVLYHLCILTYEKFHKIIRAK